MVNAGSSSMFFVGEISRACSNYKTLLLKSHKKIFSDSLLSLLI